MISTPAQGDTAQSRDGKKITIKSVLIRGLINVGLIEAGTTPNAGNRVFVALVLDKQSNTAQMNSEDCFQNQSGSALGATCPMRNLNFSNRFKVLKTVELDLNSKTLASSALNDFSWNGEQQTFEWYVKTNIDVNFNATTTSTIAAVVDNSLHVIAYSTITGNTLTYNARIRFLG